MNQEFIEALREIVDQKGISEELLFETIEDALVAAYKKNFATLSNNSQSVKVSMNRETGEIHVYGQKAVVEEVLDDANEISLEESKEYSPRYQLGDIVDIEVTPRKFGRIAAQSAKQVVIQRIKEAESFINRPRSFVIRQNGIVVAMACSARETERHVAINRVYTRPEYRGQGFAAALVAHICKLIMDCGKIPLLYTDLSNPSSNKAYKNVGFVERGKVDEITLRWDE